jgi:signal transduction histidine kinase
MRKHSGATHVVVKFEVQLPEGGLLITYADDGIGIKEGVPHQNGLRNTGNRIKAIHGELNFDSGTGKGLRIEIIFPGTA